MVFFYVAVRRCMYFSYFLRMLSFLIWKFWKCQIFSCCGFRLSSHQTNRFLHIFLGMICLSCMSNRNCISFPEWSAAKQPKWHNNFYHMWKTSQAFLEPHESTYNNSWYTIDSPLFSILDLNRNTRNKLVCYHINANVSCVLIGWSNECT